MYILTYMEAKNSKFNSRDWVTIAPLISNSICTTCNLLLYVSMYELCNELWSLPAKLMTFVTITKRLMNNENEINDPRNFYCSWFERSRKRESKEYTSVSQNISHRLVEHNESMRRVKAKCSLLSTRWSDSESFSWKCREKLIFYDFVVFSITCHNKWITNISLLHILLNWGA